MKIEDEREKLVYEYAKIILDDNSVYVGECVNGVALGKGKRTYNNGQIETGEFAYNKLEGEGERKLPDGKIIKGIFKQGNLIESVDNPKITINKQQETLCKKLKKTLFGMFRN